MTKPLSLFKALGSVLYMRYVKKYLLIVDNRYHLYVLELNGTLTLKKIRLAEEEGKKTVHRYARNFVIGSGGEVVVAYGGSNHLGLFRLGKSVSRTDIDSWHRSDVETINVSDDGGLYGTGGSDGKVFLYRDMQSDPFCTFEPRGEYISYLAFSHGGRLLASSAFDKTTRVYDLNRYAEIASFPSSETVEHALFFDKDRKLFVATRDGGSIIYDLDAKAIRSEKILFEEWPTTAALSPNGRIAAVGTKENTVYLVNLFDNKKLCRYETANNGITQIRLEGDKMIVGGIDGSVFAYACMDGAEEFAAGVETKDFHQAKEALDQNPLLYLHPSLEIFDASWSEVLKEAIRRLSIGECDVGCSIVQPFMDDPQRAEEFNFYLAQKEVFVNFIRYVETGRYKDAYALAAKETYLTRIHQYEEMEKLWERSFRAAQKTLEADRGKGPQAKEMLRAFLGVGSKAKMIRQLVENGHVFSQAEETVRAMRFHDFFVLVETYDFLKEAGIYKKVVQIGENLFQKLLSSEETRDFERYYKIADVLKVFPVYAESIAVGRERMRIKERFFRSVAEDDFQTAFSLLEQHSYLSLEREFEHLLKEFDHIYRQAEERAGRGAQAQELKEILASYVTIPYWQERIARVMREGYINELRTLGLHGGMTSDAERAVGEYIRLFSKDDILVNFMRSKGLELWLENVREKGSTAGYRRDGFPNTVLV